MSIIDKLDKKISNKKKDTEDKEKIKSDIIGKINKFHHSVYKKYFFEEFKKLEKLFKKHTKKHEDISTHVSNNLYYFSIDRTFDTRRNTSKAVKIELIDRKRIGYFSADQINDELKELKKYKFHEKNFCLKVSNLGDWIPNYVFREEISSKRFEIADKEKAYDCLTDLFQKEILFLR